MLLLSNYLSITKKVCCFLSIFSTCLLNLTPDRIVPRLRYRYLILNSHTTYYIYNYLFIHRTSAKSNYWCRTRPSRSWTPQRIRQARPTIRPMRPQAIPRARPNKARRKMPPFFNRFLIFLITYFVKLNDYLFIYLFIGVIIKLDWRASGQHGSGSNWWSEEHSWHGRPEEVK